jgi:hypothetical protein
MLRFLWDCPFKDRSRSQFSFLWQIYTGFPKYTAFWIWPPIPVSRTSNSKTPTKIWQEIAYEKSFRPKTLAFSYDIFCNCIGNSNQDRRIIPCTQAGVVRGGKFISLVGIYLGKKYLTGTEWPFSYICTFDLYGPVCNVFDACRSITRASGRGVWTWKLRLFWALLNGIEPFGECHLGPKSIKYQAVSIRGPKIVHVYMMPIEPMQGP